MENLNTALMLLGVGMGTVFCILILIIVLNNGLIRLVNKYYPEETHDQDNTKSANNAAIPAKVVTAITTAVNIVSGGKAEIKKIEKI